MATTRKGKTSGTEVGAALNADQTAMADGKTSGTEVGLNITGKLSKNGGTSGTEVGNA
jgi:hypothetical protein